MKRFLRSSRGDTEMIVLIVVIIGAFLLIGGQFFFQKTKGLGGTNGGNSNVGNGGGTSSNWRIEQVVGKANCDAANKTSQVEIAFHGNAPGFFKLEVKNGTDFQPVLINGSIYNTFAPNSQDIQVNDLTLADSDGFNSKSWRATLFQGGSVSGTDLTDSVQKAQQEFAATACP